MLCSVNITFVQIELDINVTKHEYFSLFYIEWLLFNVHQKYSIQMKNFPFPFGFRSRCSLWRWYWRKCDSLFIANICYDVKNWYKNAFKNYIYEQFVVFFFLFFYFRSKKPFMDIFNCTLKAFMLIGLSRFACAKAMLTKLYLKITKITSII